LIESVLPIVDDGAVPATSLLSRLERLVSDHDEVKSLVADALASRGSRGLSHLKTEAVKVLGTRLDELHSSWKTLAGPAVPEVPEDVVLPTSTPPGNPAVDLLYLECMSVLAIAEARR